MCSQVFTDDVHNLLSMTDMWRSRAPPEPLDFDTISSIPTSDQTLPNGHATTANGLRDQRALTLKEILVMFVSRCPFILPLFSTLSADVFSAQIVWRRGSHFPRTREARTQSHSTRMMMIRSILFVLQQICGVSYTESQPRHVGKSKVRSASLGCLVLSALCFFSTRPDFTLNQKWLATSSRQLQQLTQ